MHARGRGERASHYHVASVEVRLQFEFLVQTHLFSFSQFLLIHADHKFNRGVCVMLFVVTTEKENKQTNKQTE